MDQSRSDRYAISLVAATPVVWWWAASRGMPMLIRAAYSGALPLLGRLMPGRDTKPVEGYLAAWEFVGKQSVVAVLTASGLLLVALILRRQLQKNRSATDGQSQSAISATDLMLVAVWFGLMTGLGEAYYYVLRVFYLHRPTPGVIGISQHAVWMSPLANLIVFTLAGGLLVGARRTLKSWVDTRTLIGALASLGFLAVTMATGGLHWVATAALSAGIGATIRRELSPSGSDAVMIARRSFGALAAFVIVLGLGVPVLELARERQQLAEAPVPTVDAPNVLFIVMDTERAISTSLHGAERSTTPFLAKLAKEGAQFERAIAPASWTLPSHAAMFTGRPWTELGVGPTTPLDGKYPTLAEVLSQRGYATAGFVANVKYLSDVFGLDRGFGRWVDQRVTPVTVVDHSWLARSVVGATLRVLGQEKPQRSQTADDVNAALLGWLDHRGSPQPFFAFLNYFDVHAPYLPPKPWDKHFSDTRPPRRDEDKRDDSLYTAADRKAFEDAYESSIAYLDTRIEALIGALKQRDQFRNTLVIITSDHGEEFGEHGAIGHGFGVTMPLLHVPLVVVYPGKIPAGARVAEPVEIQRLAATVLGFTGGPDARISGESLAPHLANRGSPEGPRGAYSIDQGIASLVTGDSHFLRNRKGREWLYDTRTDPLEQHDLSEEPSQAMRRDRLRRQLLGRSATSEGKRLAGNELTRSR